MFYMLLHITEQLFINCHGETGREINHTPYTASTTRQNSKDHLMLKIAFSILPYAVNSRTKYQNKDTILYLNEPPVY